MPYYVAPMVFVLRDPITGQVVAQCLTIAAVEAARRLLGAGYALDAEFIR